MQQLFFATLIPVCARCTQHNNIWKQVFLFILMLKDLMIAGLKVNHTVVQSGRLGNKRKQTQPALLCLANSHRSFWCHFLTAKLTSSSCSLLVICKSMKAALKCRLVGSCLHNWSKQGLRCHLQQLFLLLLKYSKERNETSCGLCANSFIFSPHPMQLQGLPALRHWSL